MHILVHWEIRAFGSIRKEIVAKLKRALSGYSWVTPMSSTYIVKIESEADRALIINQLKQVCQEVKHVRYIVTPTMKGGSYQGWLPRKMWDLIKERARPDE